MIAASYKETSFLWVSEDAILVSAVAPHPRTSENSFIEGLNPRAGVRIVEFQ